MVVTVAPTTPRPYPREIGDSELGTLTHGGTPPIEVSWFGDEQEEAQ